MTNDAKFFEDRHKTDEAPKPGDLIVWYIPQVPMPAFKWPAKDLVDAANIQAVLENFSAYEFHSRVKPDYADLSGVSRYEEDGEGGFDWFDVDDEETSEALEAAGATQL